jgi:hypothetical protein
MKVQTVRRVVSTAAIVGIAIDVAAVAIFVAERSGRSGSFITAAATVAMIATLMLQATFVVVQLFANGRAMIPLRWLGPDGWFVVIASTAIPGVLWPNMAAMAVSSMRVVMPGFVTPLVVCVLLLFGRTVQQRRLRAPGT